MFVHILRALEHYLNNTSASTLMAIFPYRLQFTARKECTLCRKHRTSSPASLNCCTLIILSRKGQGVLLFLTLLVYGHVSEGSRSKLFELLTNLSRSTPRTPSRVTRVLIESYSRTLYMTQLCSIQEAYATELEPITLLGAYPGLII